MKKSIFSVLFLAALAMAFNSCEDVPEPYNDPTAKTDTVVPSVATGTGTLDDPYNAAMALQKIDEGDTTEVRYVKGIVSSFKEEPSEQYGNATYYISDDGSTEGSQFLIYRGYGLGGEKFKSASDLNIGDTVIVAGVLVNFKGTKEMTKGNKLVYLNGKTGQSTDNPSGEAKGTGTEADPYNVAGVLNVYNGTLPTTDVYVKGIVHKVTVSTKYGNADYYISDDGTSNNDFEIFRGNYLNGEKFTAEDQLQVGDTVVVCGKLTTYNTTKEMAQGSKIITLKRPGSTAGGGDTGNLKGSGTETDPYNVAAIIAAAKKLSSSDKVENVYVSGIISKVGSLNEKYGELNYYISDDGKTTTQFYVYNGYGLNGAKFTSTDELKVGQKVKIVGTLINYKGNTPEFQYGSKILSLE